MKIVKRFLARYLEYDREVGMWWDPVVELEGPKLGPSLEPLTLPHTGWMLLVSGTSFLHPFHPVRSKL